MLTKIHKPNLVERPFICGCEGSTERITSFVDRLLQPYCKELNFEKHTLSQTQNHNRKSVQACRNIINFKGAVSPFLMFS